MSLYTWALTSNRDESFFLLLRRIFGQPHVRSSHCHFSRTLYLLLSLTATCSTSIKMRPTSASIIALIALLASPSFATPLPISTTQASRSVIGIGTINGTPTGLVGDLLNKVDGLFGRDL